MFIKTEYKRYPKTGTSYESDFWHKNTLSLVFYKHKNSNWLFVHIMVSSVSRLPGQSWEDELWREWNVDEGAWVVMDWFKCRWGLSEDDVAWDTLFLNFLSVLEGVDEEATEVSAGVIPVLLLAVSNIGWRILLLALMNQLLTWSIVRFVWLAITFFSSSVGYGCTICWNNQLLMMCVACLGRIPLFWEASRDDDLREWDFFFDFLWDTSPPTSSSERSPSFPESLETSSDGSLCGTERLLFSTCLKDGCCSWSWRSLLRGK